jgi:NADH dehydrogenase
MTNGKMYFGKLKNNEMNVRDKYSNQKRVVIVGAGFAGLTLAKELSPKYFQVILIDKNNYHQFQPLLYQVATSGLEPSSISFPLRKIFQQKQNVFIRMAQVTAVSPKTKMVHTDIGDVRYDYLLLAQGATTNYFNNNQLHKNAYSMKSVSEALLLRNTLLQNYEQALNAENKEQRSSLLNVVIVGGGPTGVELAGAIAELKKKILPKDYTEINFGQMHIHLLEAAPCLLNGMSTQSGNTVVAYLNHLGVEVQTNTAVKEYDGETVLLSNGETIHSRCLIWAAGVKGVCIPGIPAGSIAVNNRILVNQYNLIKNLPEVYAIGDIALMQDDALPKGHPQVAQVAIQQAKLLAKNLQKMESGKSLIAFTYKDKGSLDTVGRNLALAEIGKLKLKGFVAWFVWMLVHLMSIISIKNRLFVLINWMWQYITYDQSLRLIIRPSDKKRKSNYMKQKLIILLATSFLLACNAGNEKEKTIRTEPDAENHAEHAEQATGLALNNGVKWKADSTTVLNVDLLQKIVAGAKKESLESYSQTAIDLQGGLNKMVSECKMKGADHEALHHWLEPLMDKTKELKNANTIETARTIFGEIEKQINLFSQYFE